jgi:hypothetical protein
MKTWRELDHETKLLAVIVASWIVPPLLWHMAWLDEPLQPMLITIAYLGFFIGILNLVVAIREAQHVKGRDFQLRALQMDDLIKDKSDPAWEEYFKRNKFTAEEIEEAKNS